MSTATPTASPEDGSTAPISSDSPRPIWLMRGVAALIGCAAVANFWWANSRSEAYLVQYEKFAPWSWNLYLALFLAAAVGLFSLMNQAKWGLWLFAFAAMSLVFTEFYTLDLSLAMLRIPVAVVAVWLATQPVIGRLK